MTISFNPNTDGSYQLSLPVSSADALSLLTQMQQVLGGSPTPTPPPPTPTPTPTPTPAPGDPAIQAAVQDMLNNIKQNGYNPAQKGLYINWRYGTSPLQTNLNGSNATDNTRHDPLTDARYVHALWMYKKRYGSTDYDSELARYEPIVKAEFAGSSNERGWLYDQLFWPLYTLSGDTAYRDIAKGLAASYFNAITPKAPVIFKTAASGNPGQHGYYRPFIAIGQACALIMAGTTFATQEWVNKGHAMIDFLYTHAIVQGPHKCFADQLDNVLTPQGAINPDETFLMIPKTPTSSAITGNQLRMGSSAQIILSLFNAAAVTGDSSLLAKAQEQLDLFDATTNPLGLWDHVNGGYFGGLNWSGTGPHNPGTQTMKSGKKESGRQISMLYAYNIANQLTSGKYAATAKLMLDVALNKAIYKTQHGVLYETQDNWAPVSHGTWSEDWATTEASGACMEGLLTA